MEELTPVERYSHANDNPVNVNVEYKDMLTTGQKAPACGEYLHHRYGI
jgi:hypothetical protein